LGLEKERLGNEKKDYKSKFWKNWFPDGFKKLLSRAFTSPHCSKALEFTVLAPIWTNNLAKQFFGGDVIRYPVPGTCFPKRVQVSTFVVKTGAGVNICGKKRQVPGYPPYTHPGNASSEEFNLSLMVQHSLFWVCWAAQRCQQPM
jgi:hypothetical protein